MKKLAAITVIGAALALSACSNNGKSVDYGYEKQAPYASDRTVGTTAAPAPAKGDTVFKAKQNK